MIFCHRFPFSRCRLRLISFLTPSFRSTFELFTNNTPIFHVSHLRFVCLLCYFAVSGLLSVCSLGFLVRIVRAWFSIFWALLLPKGQHIFPMGLAIVLMDHHLSLMISIALVLSIGTGTVGQGEWRTRSSMVPTDFAIGKEQSW